MKRAGQQLGSGRKLGPQKQSAKMMRERHRRHLDAIANWQTAWNLRKQRMTFKAVGQVIGVSESRAAVLCYNYEEHLLNQITKKSA